MPASKIRHASEDSIETDFKQVAGYSSDKILLRVSVVKIDEKTSKFHVRVKNESLERVKTGETRDKEGEVVGTNSQVVETENEFDESYFVETLDRHEKLHREVCGG